MIPLAHNCETARTWVLLALESRRYGSVGDRKIVHITTAASKMIDLR